MLIEGIDGLKPELSLRECIEIRAKMKKGVRGIEAKFRDMEEQIEKIRRVIEYQGEEIFDLKISKIDK